MRIFKFCTLELVLVFCTRLRLRQCVGIAAGPLAGPGQAARRLLRPAGWGVCRTQATQAEPPGLWPRRRRAGVIEINEDENFLKLEVEGLRTGLACSES
jgi:hypothetical protein